MMDDRVPEMPLRTAWSSLRLYGAEFRPWIGGEGSAPARLTAQRLAVLQSVTKQYGTGPALAWLLQRYPLDKEQQAYVRLTLLYSRAKARERRTDIMQLAAGMNAIGVSPLLLKGSAAQLGGIYPDPGFRLMADMDLLVPADCFGACERAAESAGFKVVTPLGRHHANQQYNQHRLALLELHTRVTRWHGRSNLSEQELLATATPMQIDGVEVLIPDWTLHAVINIVHAFSWDECSLRAHVPLKAMLDLAALRVAGVVAWDRVQERLIEMGERRALCDVEVLFQYLFQVSLTDVEITPAKRARILRWYRWGATYPVLGRIAAATSAVRLRAKIVQKEPGRAKRLLTSSFYVRFASAIKEALDPKTPKN